MKLRYFLTAIAWLCTSQSHAIHPLDGLTADAYTKVAEVLPGAGKIDASSRFANYHLWITPCDTGERYAAGNYPNQHPAFSKQLQQINRYGIEARL